MSGGRANEYNVSRSIPSSESPSCTTVLLLCLPQAKLTESSRLGRCEKVRPSLLKPNSGYDRQDQCVVGPREQIVFNGVVDHAQGKEALTIIPAQNLTDDDVADLGGEQERSPGRRGGGSSSGISDIVFLYECFFEVCGWPPGQCQASRRWNLGER